MQHTYNISIFTEDIVGLLNRITIIFTRRHVNIESITASECEIKGIYRYTIVVTVGEEQVIKLVQQIDKQVEVLKAFYHLNSEVISREIGLYKLSSAALEQNEALTAIISNHYARIISVSPQYVVVEKTGNEEEIMELFNRLLPFNVLEFARSGKVAITKPMRTLTEYLSELENSSHLTIKHFNQ